MYHHVELVFTFLSWAVIRVGNYCVITDSYMKTRVLCLRLIKPPSNFTWGLKVSCRAYNSFFINWNKQSSSCHHTEPGSIISVTWIFYFTQVLLPTKPQSDFAVAVNVTQSLTLLAVKSVLFSHHINCFSGCMFTSIAQLLRLLSCKLLHTCKGTIILLVCWHILITWSSLFLY
jgi:hypothetical protein